MCLELPVGSGYIDNLYVTGDGDLVIAECKLWRNPEARREVVAQIIDYAHSLASWTYQDLERAVRQGVLPTGGKVTESLHDIIQAQAELDEAHFVDADTAHLAETTRHDEARYLDRESLLLRHLGELRLDEIDAAVLRRWWVDVVETPYRDSKGREQRRTPSTGRRYLDVLAAVLGYARDLDIIKSRPVADFREQLRRRNRTKRGRSQSAPDRHIRPIESPRDLGRLVYEASIEGPEALVVVLLQLDAGLRLGEGLGVNGAASAGVQMRTIPRAAC